MPWQDPKPGQCNSEDVLTSSPTDKMGLNVDSRDFDRL